jgi:DNA-binding beta-propeller fold protein YncE
VRASLCVLLALLACHGRALRTSKGGVASYADGRYLYAVQGDGSVHVYAIDSRHREVDVFDVALGATDLRGVCASAARLFVAALEASGGRVVAVDLATNAIAWSRAFQPSVDRLACTPDGKKLYVPCNEAQTDDCVIVIDGASGDEISRLHVSPRPHDALVNRSGSRLYVETKSASTIAVVDTQSDTIVGQVAPFADIVGPYVFDASESRLYANVFGVNGYQVADLASGAVATVHIPLQSDGIGGRLNQHGVGLRPAGAEVWVLDGVSGLAAAHVFDAKTNAYVRDVQLTYSDSHWITFTISGDFAYVAGPKATALSTDVVAGVVTAVGDQYGIGR